MSTASTDAPSSSLSRYLRVPSLDTRRSSISGTPIRKRSASSVRSGFASSVISANSAAARW
jgi:hypothetical protein